MKGKAFIPVLSLVVCLSVTASGAPRAAAEPMVGVVVNQTVTVAGQEFFQHFTASWRERELGERYAILVVEKPSARTGSQVWVEFSRRRVFQAQLPNARGELQTLGEQAAEIAYQRIADTELERLLAPEPDLGADEI